MASVIHVLSDHVINKIAAGEVVERPASALKELMENALDAGAHQIDVEIADGGRSLARVSDDGAGMSPDNALLAIERHATSKIRDVGDIERINTLGFRGEALAAISSVSRFSMKTRPEADLSGTEITIHAGKIQDVREIGCAPGTVVEARNLFFNVPARRKFLRTVSTETDHVRKIFITMALARPETGWSLTIDRRRVYYLPTKSGLMERLGELFPSMPTENLRSLNFARAGITVAGYAGLPALSRRDRGEQYVFVNGRPAVAPVLFAAIRAGYHGLLPTDRQPVLFLFIETDAGMVDVNVHPTKKEVRFRDSGAIRAVIAEAIVRALKPSASEPGPVVPSVAAVQADPPPGLPSLGRFIGAMQPRAWPVKNPARPIGAPLSAIGATGSCPGAAVVDKDTAGGYPAGGNGDWSWYRVLGFIGGRYAVLETGDGLALLDPHAAHERILFERFRHEIQARKVVVQPLLSAITMDFPPTDSARIRRNLDLLRSMGVGIAEFGGNTFVIDALPACLDFGTPEKLLTDLAASMEQAEAARSPREEQLIRAACHAAVKAVHPLDELQVSALLEQLIRTEMPYTCPHGRPTLIHISTQELNRKFGRE